LFELKLLKRPTYMSISRTDPFKNWPVHCRPRNGPPGWRNCSTLPTAKLCWQNSAPLSKASRRRCKAASRRRAAAIAWAAPASWASWTAGARVPWTSLTAWLTSRPWPPAPEFGGTQSRPASGCRPRGLGQPPLRPNQWAHRLGRRGGHRRRAGASRKISSRRSPRFMTW